MNNSSLTPITPIRAKKVLVAISGGVDSAVAAFLLKEAGCEVIGATMHLWVAPFSRKQFVTGETVNAAEEVVSEGQRVASILDIPHIVLDLQDRFYRDIVCGFTGEYMQGRTPNPCVICNHTIKFSALLSEAQKRGFGYVATGHYSRSFFDHASGSYKLCKALDDSKDQSYMLYRLGQQELSATVFPLGDKTKRSVWEIAETRGLIAAGKTESQEICFIPDNDYRTFLERECPQAGQDGDIVSTGGQKLGRHRGIAFYTVGQRKGLGITSPCPLYVIRIDARHNQVVVGSEAETYSSGLLAGNLNFISGVPPEQELLVDVKIRYRAPAVPAILFPPQNGLASVTFKEKQKAVTPGQSAVFYRDDEVLGGGIIENSTDST